MPVLHEEEYKKETINFIAKKMVLAARTAPKARGIDNITAAIIDCKEKTLIAEKMKEISSKENIDFFARDAENVIASDVLILIGTKIQSVGLKKCGMCGFANCEEKNKQSGIPCVFNTGDLGIAVGSAVSIAMDNRIDNRVMYTVGQAALELGIFDKSVKIIYGIPLAATSKNIFFDRK